MDELDLTAAESKATYEEIKDYVLKQSGLKVSSLYIAQVKQNCGIYEILPGYPDEVLALYWRDINNLLHVSNPKTIE